jgi:adenylate kinase family enzyme
MNKIIIIGTTGSGKSTLAKQLSMKLNIPYIQLDFLFWKPNWEQPTDEEFFSKIEIAIEKPRWILDGNYGRTNHLTWKKADTVIWIDLPFWLTFYQNIKRSIIRAINRKEIWEGTGNKESFLRMFSKDSIILWLFKTYDSNVSRYQSRMNDSNFSHITFYRLRSRKEISGFIKNNPL